MERVLCKALLRAIPNNREVFDAEWNNKAVIVKVFSQRLVSRIRFRREWGGLAKLGRRGINAPKPLFCGKTAKGKLAIVTEKVADSQTIAEVYRKQADKVKQVELLIQVATELARQHEKGVLQKDLHLGNFLLNGPASPKGYAEAGDKIVMLDPAEIRFFHRPIGRKKSVSQLALLTNKLDSKDVETARSVWREYFNGRKWQFRESDEQLLRKEAARHKRNWLRRALRKCLRTSKKFLRIKKDGYTAVFNGQFIAGTEPIDFLRSIDELMEKGVILKRGNTSFVSRLAFNGRDIVIKRYNHKGFFHSLRHTLKKTRAKQSWLYGHRLTWLGIPTPKPLAYIEQRKGGLAWKSYLITEYVEGQKLCNLPESDGVTRQRRSDVIRELMGLLDNLGQYRISHGDLKHSNILITNNGPVLTDLDAMKVHRLNWTYKKRRIKDKERLIR
ncbi:MAG: hypothetical protein JW749_00880 [Sedimentisphaerales bacterium]|nr:hypothetical protein [Sedimentisphaerales bacterium]